MLKSPLFCYAHWARIFGKKLNLIKHQQNVNVERKYPKKISEDLYFGYILAPV